MTQAVPHLVCSVGIPRRSPGAAGPGAYEEVRYRLGEGHHTTPFAPVALARVKRLEGGRVSILATARAQAQDAYRVMVGEFREFGMEPEPVLISEGRNESEILEAFHMLVEAVPPGAPVILDVTFSLRHLPFVYLAALAYLTAYRGVTIQGIYYGAFDLRVQAEDGVTEAPILDISPLFGLTQWYHALQTALESGNLRPLVASFRRDVSHFVQSSAGSPDILLSSLTGMANRLADDLAAGLPLEVGRAAHNLREALHALEERGAPRQVGYLSLATLTDELAAWAISEAVQSKTDVSLTEEELARQLALAEWFLKRRDVPKALLLLREWLVSLLVLRRSDPGRWLDRNYRETFAHYLNGLAERAKRDLATEAEQQLTRAWNGVTNRRNLLAHAGMTIEQGKEQGRKEQRRQDWISISPTAVEHLIRECRVLLTEPTVWDNLRLGAGRLLVTPLGLSPGVLYSAVRHIRPDRVVVITSTEGRQRLPEALAAAGVAELPVVVRELAEPMTGFQEGRALVDGDLRRHLVEAGEVVVNLTGGTTVIQYAVEQVAREAGRLGVPVRRVAVVDRRTPEEQRAQPFVLGELVELDGAAPEAEQEE